jgi:hypothetical protein
MLCSVISCHFRISNSTFADFSLNAPLLNDADYRAEESADLRPSHLSKFFFGWCMPFISKSRHRLLEVSEMPLHRSVELV